jgi:phosphate transport system substrate-binding protein
MAAMVLTLAVATFACSSSDSNDVAAGDSETTVDLRSLTGTINGSGASFQDTFQQTVIDAFRTAAPNATVNYTKSGSSAGKRDLAARTVAFAGTDSLIKDEELARFQGEVLYFPIAAAPITVAYDVAGLDELRLSPDTLAGIFGGSITTWDDPAIAADNPDVDLPSAKVTVVHRSDGSGTTNNFTKYLTKAAPEKWTLGSGDTVNWPSGMQGAEKNSGVAALVASTAGAIGYVDLADAASANLTTALIRNSSGRFVAPKLPAASAALAGATLAEDLTYDPLDAEGAEAYPITAPTWVVVEAQQPDLTTVDLLQGYLEFVLTRGQELAPTVGYAAIPDEMISKALAQLEEIGT